MKKLLSFLVLFGGLSVAMAQKTIIPEVKVVSEDNVHPMQLQDLSVDILVVGQTAVTTMEMTFYNPNNRVMEGEFEFPLAEGQQISRFALDIDGKLREGVVVDKSLGRKAFEDIVRRGVDPGLLEKTEGNNFRARVYPMPRKGSRRILIAFEQELSQKNGQDSYCQCGKTQEVQDSYRGGLSLCQGRYPKLPTTGLYPKPQQLSQ